jgi:hypothetical protein
MSVERMFLLVATISFVGLVGATALLLVTSKGAPHVYGPGALGNT